MPFQSNDEFKIASMKSPLGRWSVQCRWPWNPATRALWPSASSPKPSSANRGLPTIMSRAIMAIFTDHSQTRSFSAAEN